MRLGPEGRRHNAGTKTRCPAIIGSMRRPTAPSRSGINVDGLAWPWVRYFGEAGQGREGSDVCVSKLVTP
jgi:hypothetical protein